MTDPTYPTGSPGIAAPASPSRRFNLIDRIATVFAASPTPFEIIFPDGQRRSFGTAPPSFTVTLRDRQALRAVASMDEGRFGDAYMEGHLDIEGDLLRPFEIRR